jgi:organic hydroperoxide reductase OsmC/OhrA
MPAASRWRWRWRWRSARTARRRAAGRDRGLPLDEVAGAPRVTSVELAVRTRVPRLDKAGLARTVAPVAVLCPVANAARGNVEITVRHQVDEA